MPNCPPMFAALNESTLRGWFEVDGRTLKQCPMAAVEALKRGECAQSVLHLGHDNIWGGREDIELEFFQWMLDL